MKCRKPLLSPFSAKSIEFFWTEKKLFHFFSFGWRNVNIRKSLTNCHQSNFMSSVVGRRHQSNFLPSTVDPRLIAMILLQTEDVKFVISSNFSFKEWRAGGDCKEMKTWILDKFRQALDGLGNSLKVSNLDQTCILCFLTLFDLILLWTTLWSINSFGIAAKNSYPEKLQDRKVCVLYWNWNRVMKKGCHNGNRKLGEFFIKSASKILLFQDNFWFAKTAFLA